MCHLWLVVIRWTDMMSGGQIYLMWLYCLQHLSRCVTSFFVKFLLNVQNTETLKKDNLIVNTIKKIVNRVLQTRLQKSAPLARLNIIEMCSDKLRSAKWDCLDGSKNLGPRNLFVMIQEDTGLQGWPYCTLQNIIIIIIINGQYVTQYTPHNYMCECPIEFAA